MNRDAVKNILSRYSKYPRFEDGKIDYSEAEEAAVINVVVTYKDDILLLKRSNKVHYYKGLWMVVAGYLDEAVSVEEKALEELYEEAGITQENLRSLEVLSLIEVDDSSTNTKWVVFPVRAELNEKIIPKIDYEHDEARWVKPDDIKDMDVIPFLSEIIEAVTLK